MWLVFLGLVASSAIGYAGWRKGALSLSGMVSAILVGTLIFGLGGWLWGVLLVAFFVSSSLLSRFKDQEKAALAEKFAKGHQRDMGQVLANGGLGAVIAVLAALYPNPLWLAAFVGAMATVNADTWATELGVLSPNQPKLITNGRTVEVGTSGGVTLLGTAATLGGGLFIGMLAAIVLLFERNMEQALLMMPAGMVGGLAGSLFDSLLGATVQAIYYCHTCNKETEQSLHRCGTPTELVRGLRWLSNDLVNLTSSAVGAFVALALANLLG